MVKNHSIPVVETLQLILYHQSSCTSTRYPTKRHSVSWFKFLKSFLYLGCFSTWLLLVGLFCRATRCSPGCAEPDLPATWSWWVWHPPGHDTHLGPYVKKAYENQEDCVLVWLYGTGLRRMCSTYKNKDVSSTVNCFTHVQFSPALKHVMH